MTETVSGSAKGTQARRKGLKIERIFSTEGVHPYDELNWERRDVVQTNWKTGDTVFEQRGVEYPDFWSVNASTIVTTKYFRGALGTDVREWSLRQLIDRVVKTYTQAGTDHGYFKTQPDADVFEHELTWLLAHQYVSVIRGSPCSSFSAGVCRAVVAGGAGVTDAAGGSVLIRDVGRPEGSGFPTTSLRAVLGQPVGWVSTASVAESYSGEDTRSARSAAISDSKSSADSKPR